MKVQCDFNLGFKFPLPENKMKPQVVSDDFHAD